MADIFTSVLLYCAQQNSLQLNTRYNFYLKTLHNKWTNITRRPENKRISCILLFCNHL